MNRSLLPCFLLLLAGCINENKTPPQAIQNSTASAQANTTIVTEVQKDSVTPTKQEQSPAAIDTGRVYFTNGYCGGAPPPPDVIAAYDAQYPMSNSTILLIAKKNPTVNFELSTNNKGSFYAALPEGDYFVKMTSKFDKNNGCSFRSDCKQWIEMNFDELRIRKKKHKGYKIVLNFGCNPCEPTRP